MISEELMDHSPVKVDQVGGSLTMGQDHPLFMNIDEPPLCMFFSRYSIDPLILMLSQSRLLLLPHQTMTQTSTARVRCASQVG